MDTYSDEEKMAVMELVFDAMVVSGEKNDPEQTKYLQVVADLMLMDNEFFEKAMNTMDLNNAIQIVSKMSIRERSRIAIIIFQMFTANNKSISEKQKKYFNFIDNGIHFKEALHESNMINWVSNIRMLL